MSNTKRNFQQYRDSLIDALDAINYHEIYQLIDIIKTRLDYGGKLILFGNGGSASQAQHLATELICSFKNRTRPSIPALALNSDIAALTAISNDFSFEDIFSRQLESLTGPYDTVLALSTSGNSPNVIKALKLANKLKIPTIGFTGKDGGKMKDLCSQCFIVNSNDTEHIQEAHLAVGHFICQEIEKDLVASKA